MHDAYRTPALWHARTQLLIRRILLALFLMAAVGAGVLGWLFMVARGIKRGPDREKHVAWLDRRPAAL